MGRLRIEVGQSALAEEHEKLLRALTRGGLGAWVEPAEAPISGYSEEALEGARSLWRRRMVQEHNSSAVWAGVLPQLVEAEVTLDLKTAVLRAGLDELRHAALCAQVLRALGAEPEAEAELALTPVARHANCPALERPLRNLLFVGCLAETVAVAVTAEERQLARESYIVRVLEVLHADETTHGRLGWIVLRDQLPRLDETGRARLAAYLPVAFAYLERETLAAIPDAPVPPEPLLSELHALGVSEAAAARTLFYQSIEHVIVPELEALGLGAERAWKERLDA
ncbi:MAG: hypothetical protein KC503_10060 [Myxococcales bacterium]|nr:hypothetical protein [Myxococcales bacterium]